ncbi:MAG TPA: mechanosensitive ion channel family protein [Spirochaetales bacterium]|nr:mechanosensitive ion channel family protein [Spirochaetales bacterium]
MDILDWIKNIPADILRKLATVGITLVIGIIFIRLILYLSSRTFFKRLSEHSRLIIRNLMIYTASAILLITVLRQLGFDVSTLLGAAGILGVAVGFASQTSVSNVISGIFLISERPFEIGDVIRIGDKTGIIISIDLMSIKIRTFDNLFIRIPNQMVLNTDVTNITRFPIRRMDIQLTVAYKENLERVREILMEVIEANPYALREPEPLLIFQNFGASGLDIFLGVWFQKQDFLNLKNSLMQGIKERFVAEGIEIALPHRSLYAGSVTEPFPIRIVNE